MKSIQSKRFWGVVPFLAFALTAMLSVHRIGVGQQAPAGAPAAPAARGGGRGGAAPPLGDGPWDVGDGENRVHVTMIAKGMDHPFGMAFLPNCDMLVTERAARLRVVRKGVLDPVAIAGLPQILVKSLGGLLDIALHPNFAQNRLIYLAYSKP